mgnify:FL=1
MTRLKIKPVTTLVTDQNRYCGPAVISCVTGMNTGEAARLIRSVSGQKAVRGSFTTHVRKAFELCGIESFRKTNSRNCTLAAWLRESKDIRTTGRVFFVVAGHHFQLIEGRRYVCGRTMDIVSIKDKSVKRRCRVEEVYELKAEGKIIIPDRAKKPKRKYDQHRPFVQKMKQKYGFMTEWKQEGGYGDYWVEMPSHAEDLAYDMEHELSDDHTCYDMADVAGRMERMAEFMEEYCVE